MAVKNPRVQVTLKPHEYALLRRLAELQGRSMSALMADVWETVHPVMERVAVVLDAAKKAQAESTAGLRSSVEKAEREIAPLLSKAVDQFDIFLADAGLDSSQFLNQSPPPAGESRTESAPSRPPPRSSTPVTSNHGGQVVKSRRRRGGGS